MLGVTVQPSPATAAGVAAVSGALLAGLTVLVIAAPSVPLDTATAGWPPGGRSAWLVEVMDVVRFVAAQAPFVLTVVVGLALWRRHRLVAALLVGNFAGSMLVSIVLKVAVNRERPGGGGALPAGTTEQASFPSSSVVACVAFWGFLGAVVAMSGTRGWWQRALLAGSLLLVVLIGPSRLYVGDHWLSDVVAGYLLSISGLSLCLWVLLRRSRRDPGTRLPARRRGVRLAP